MKRREFVKVLGAGGWGLGGLGGLVGVPRLRFRDDVFVERWSWAMGQSVHLMVFTGAEQEGLDACAAALAELRRVESRLTLFDDASDLCELNRRAGRKAMRVDQDLSAVLARAAGFRRATGGAFDVAVEPLMRAWGFHRPRTPPRPPTAAELAEAREAVRAAVVELDGDVARLPSGHTQLDFGSIGVGYGIDRALVVLRARGVRRAFLDVSGDMAAIGAPPGEPGWRVDVADPGHPGATVAHARLRDAALATAANTESIVRCGALIVGHVLDAATGWPARALKQASVVTRTATAADALSTAMLVSGKASPAVLRSYAV